MHIGLKRQVDKMGRVVIPKEYRELYNIKELNDVYVLGTEYGLLIQSKNYKVIEVEDTEL